MRTFILALVMVWLGSAAPIAAQPELGEEPEGGAITVPVALALARAHYQSGPLGERVAVRASGREGEERRGTFTVRLAASDPARPIARVDAEDLQVYLSPGRAVAAHRQNPAAMFEWDAGASPGPASLVGRMPALPLPQLALARTGDAVTDDLTPYTGPVAWQSVTETGAGDRRELLLRGVSPQGEVFLTIGATTGRMRRLVVQLGEERVRTRIELSIVPVRPGELSEWEIPAAGRERVSSIDALRAATPELKTGERVPNLALLDPEFAPWSLVEALRATPAQPGLVLVFFRVPADGPRSAEIEDAARGLVRALVREGAAGEGEPRKAPRDMSPGPRRDSLPAAPPDAAPDNPARERIDAPEGVAGGLEPAPGQLVVHPVAVFDADAFARDALVGLHQRWGTPPDEADAPGWAHDGLLWSPNAKSTLDRLGERRDIAVVALTPDLIVRHTRAFDGAEARRAPADEIARAVRIALEGAAMAPAERPQLPSSEKKPAP